MANPETQEPSYSYLDEPPFEEQLDQKPQVRGRARQWGSILLVIGVVWLVFELAGRGAFFNFSVAGQVQPLESQVFAASSLVVNSVNDDVDLVRWDEPTIKVVVVKHGFGQSNASVQDQLDQLNITINQNGDTVNVNVQPQGPSFAFFRQVPSISLQVFVPDDVTLDVSTVSGELRLEDVAGNGQIETTNGDIVANNTSGTLTFAARSGDVRLDGYQGALTFNTVSGDVDVRDAASTSVQGQTTSGDVSLDGGAGTLAITTISGDVEIQEADNATLTVKTTSGGIEFAGHLADVGSQRIETISGDVTLTLSAPDNVRLDLNTLSGDLDTDLDLTDRVNERRRITGQTGTGSTALIVTTTSGDIEVDSD